MLKLRILQPTDTYPHALPHIYTTNDEVDKYNKDVYDKCSQLKTIISAQDFIVGDVTQSVKESMKSRIPSLKLSKTVGLFLHLPVAIGIRYEVCINVRTDDGLTNGAPGKIMHMDYREQQRTRPTIIWMQFEDQQIGQKWCQQHKHLSSSSYLMDDAIPVSRDFCVGHIKKAKVLRKQFPKRPPAAKTVHKSQGDTLPQLVVHLPYSKLHFQLTV